MKRATIFVLVFALLSALMTLGTFAEETWTNAELTFYNASGTAEDPADSDGDSLEGCWRHTYLRLSRFGNVRYRYRIMQ